MPHWLEILLVVLLVVVVVLFLGGLIANARARAAGARRLTRRIEEANRALAEARADDRGWDPEVLEAAAREVLDERRPGARVERLELLQVVDLPGVDEDRAVFHAEVGDRHERVELVRTGGSWAPA